MENFAELAGLSGADGTFAARRLVQVTAPGRRLAAVRVRFSGNLHQALKPFSWRGFIRCQRVTAVVILHEKAWQAKELVSTGVRRRPARVKAATRRRTAILVLAGFDDPGRFDGSR